MPINLGPVCVRERTRQAMPTQQNFILKGDFEYQARVYCGSSACMSKRQGVMGSFKQNCP